ncbi:hypothetical protein [Nocardioides salarius]|uniref:hypothetical protein n=1 Tax=Nocardioides salarius TaxID=374513 RepID=UPI0030F8068F
MLGIFASPALAVEEPAVAAPVILAPADGASLEVWDSRFSIDFGAAPGAVYNVNAAWGNGTGTRSWQGFYGPESGTQSFRLSQAVQATSITITVASRSQSEARDTITFYVRGYSAPRITDIGEDQVLTPWDGEVDLDFTGAEPGQWTVQVYNQTGGNSSVETTYSGTASTARQTLRVRSNVSPGGYTIYLVRDELTYGGVQFTSAPRLKVSNLKVPSGPIYPTVRDGFRDSAKISFRVSEASTSTVTVHASNGREVFTKQVRTPSPSRTNRVTWNARGAEPGRYKVLVTARKDADPSVSGKARARITAVTDTVATKKTITKKGTQTAKRIVRGNCYTSGYSGDLRLDCWGTSNREFAEARYAFKFPANATNLRWTMTGAVGCCDTGQLIRSSRRTSKISGYVFARVTNFRSYTVRKVALSYTYQRKR